MSISAPVSLMAAMMITPRSTPRRRAGARAPAPGVPPVGRRAARGFGVRASAIPRGLPSMAQGRERLGIVTFNRSDAIICSEPPSFDDLLRTAQST